MRRRTHDQIIKDLNTWQRHGHLTWRSDEPVLVDGIAIPTYMVTVDGQATAHMTEGQVDEFLTKAWDLIVPGK